MTAGNYIAEEKKNRWRSIVLLGGTFVVLLLVVNVIGAALIVGPSLRQSCSYSTTTGAQSCQTNWSPLIGLTIISAIGIAVYLLIAYGMSARAALKINRATPATGPEYAQLRNLVAEMAIAAGLPTPDVYVINDPAPNAFATGLTKDKATVVVTTGLLATMSRRELEGVLAHEMSHIRNGDMRMMTIAVLSTGAIIVLCDVIWRIAFFSGRARNRQAGVLVLIGLLMYLFAIPAALLLQAMLSRKREALADATAVELTRNPRGLRSALEKLEASTTVVRERSHATAHLWIESPLDKGARGGFVSRLFDTHPPIASRIALLRQEEGLDPASRGPNDAYPQAAISTAPAGAAAPGPIRGIAPLPGAALVSTPAHSPALPPAGWYSDPETANTQRYWNGTAWTENRAPA